MKKMRILFAGLLVGMTALNGFAQTNLMRFTDYNMVQPVINPARMGTASGVNGLLLYRTRFENSDVWPSTGVLNLHTLIEEKNLGGGLNLVFDKYGPYQKLHAYVAGTYRLQVNEGRYLFFGIQAGVNYVGIEPEYVLHHEEETIFSDNYSQPNFGFGMHYQAENYFIGLSIPEFRYNTINEEGIKVSSTMSDMLKMFLYGGYRFRLAENTDLEPYSYLSYSGEEGTDIDLGARLIHKNNFIIGAQYRTEQAFAAMVRVRLTEGLWLGYAFEGNNSDIDNSFNSVQEIGLTFHFGGRKAQGSSRASEQEQYDDINSIRYF
ncbi:MAG: type IX secretion system membrane protein PorP/SprF [Culturomica sp.]|jgi:type IX secretion system PorP/SprF family membrane protein|nr:type IX secretion system membrane protein PorP/SprF [Culturomica sp.]